MKFWCGVYPVPHLGCTPIYHYSGADAESLLYLLLCSSLRSFLRLRLGLNIFLSRSIKSNVKLRLALISLAVFTLLTGYFVTSLPALFRGESLKHSAINARAIIS